VQRMLSFDPSIASGAGGPSRPRSHEILASRLQPISAGRAQLRCAVGGADVEPPVLIFRSYRTPVHGETNHEVLDIWDIFFAPMCGWATGSANTRHKHSVEHTLTRCTVRCLLPAEGRIKVDAT
jgi:hypothetical protein